MREVRRVRDRRRKDGGLYWWRLLEVLCREIRERVSERFEDCEVQVMTTKKITKTSQREILKDIRRQLVWVEQAIKDGDQDWIDQYALQLCGTASLLHSDRVN